MAWKGSSEARCLAPGTAVGVAVAVVEVEAAYSVEHDKGELGGALELEET